MRGEARLQRIWEEGEVALCCQVIGLITQRVETIRRPPEVAAVSRQLEHIGELSVTLCSNRRRTRKECN